MRPTAQLLFDLIVVRPLGCGLWARLRARLALQSLASQALSRVYGRSKTLYKRLLASQIAIFLRPEFFIMFVPMLIAELVMFAHIQRHSYFLTSSRWFAMVATVLFLAGAVLAVTSKSAISAVRLWFICCATMGVSREEISVVAGRRTVSPLAEYLDVTEMLSRSRVPHFARVTVPVARHR